MCRLFALIMLLLTAMVAHGEEPINFETQIAPILSNHCASCHSDNNAKGDISLARADDLRENGHIEPGSPKESYLLELISGVDDEPPEMPKDAPPLPAEQVALVRRWIEEGAKWPEDVIVREASKADASWWSLQPIQRDHGDKSIDDFIESKLAAEKLSQNPPADRLTLIRRASYDLTGLPPTPAEIDAFEKDRDEKSWEKLVDRLLASPHYGERWARHWLDVVRFGESNGFERNVINNNIWPFRDYVIRSINEDKPFDQFIREHLAGDVFGADDPDVAVGSAFLVAGPYDDVGNQDAVQAAQIRANTLDEIISATSQAFLGLTVGCARCHDHKFDPILQSDYYAFYATFAGVRHGSAPLATPEAKAKRSEQLEPLEAERTELEKQLTEIETKVLNRAHDNIDDYSAKWTRPPVNRTGTEERFEPVTAKFVRLVCEARDSAIKSKTGFRIDEFEIWSEETEGQPSTNVALAAGTKATGPSRHIEDFADAYSASLAIDGAVGARFIAASDHLTIELEAPTSIERVVFSSARGATKLRQGKFAFVAEYRIEVSNDGETWQEVANGRDRKPTDVASNPTHEEWRLRKLAITTDESAEQKRLRKTLQKVKAKIAKIPALPSVYVGKRNANDAAGPFHVFLGGSPQKKGDPISPRSLSVLADANPYELKPESPEADRRNALADWITSSQNPLTARVLANRIWQYHFGRGIVDTPSDFGYMGDRPSHPELLDFLATKLIKNEWRLKPIHRLIMMSKTYRQSSKFSKQAARVDGDARLLWRYPPRRLSAEEIRDTILLVTGKLEKQTSQRRTAVPDGGPGFRLYHFMQDNVCTYVPLDKHGPETYRRAIYHQNARASVVDMMTDFDQPDCAFSTPKRAQTTTPLQALTMLNHSFTLDMANALAERVTKDTGNDSKKQISRAYRLCFGRRPADAELQTCLKLANEHGLEALCRVLLNTSELIYVH